MGIIQDMITALTNTIYFFSTLVAENILLIVWICIGVPVILWKRNIESEDLRDIEKSDVI